MDWEYNRKRPWGINRVGDGYYYLDSDGAGPLEPYRAYCDLNTRRNNAQTTRITVSGRSATVSGRSATA